MPSRPYADADQVATIVQSRSQASTAPEGVFVLTVTAGPDRGMRIELDGSQPSRVLVGQSPACDVRLTDREVSRRHIAFEPTPRGLRIVDLDSTNGTFVDRVRIREAELTGEEIVRAGATAFLVEFRPSDHLPEPPEADSFGRFVGISRAMRCLYPLCARLAVTNVPVIIEGESGTEKKVLAESLHEQEPRAREPFVVFDCTAVPPNLVESELFGHERGAFTGAVTARKGVFELAHGGTLLIDEIGDLELSLQPKLLRAIERSEVRRVGGDQPQKIDVRVLAATRRDLDQEVEAGRFRDDLFHRLAVARIELPPLRHRLGDIPMLVRHFCQQLEAAADAIGADVIERWQSYAWPGNVRELRNAVARRLALGELDEGARSGRPSTRPPDGATDPIKQVLELPFARARDRLMAEFERRYVERLLALHGGNVATAAAASGIGRRYFQMIRARSSK